MNRSHSAIREITTGSTVNAAIVENTTPPNDCTQSNEGNNAKFRMSSSIACISNVAAQPAGLGNLGGNQPSLHDSERRNKTETCYRAPFSVHAPNKKSEHSSTKSKKHNAYDEGHALPQDVFV